MFAGRILAPGRIELIEVPEPRLPETPAEDGSGFIIFQPQTTCLCGSDLPYFDGAQSTYPLEIGHSLHEMIGVVAETSGKRFKPGDKILAVPIHQVGLFERFCVSEKRAIPVDPRCTPEQAVLAQPLGTVLYALRKLPNLIDQTAAIVGQGPMGQLFSSALSHAGARRIIAIDKLSSRLQASLKMGATSTVDASRTDPIDAVKELTGGRLADLVIECVGHRNQAFNLCIDLCKHQGRILFFGVPPAAPLNGLRWHDLFMKNITVHTSVDPDFELDFPLSMRLIAEGRIDVLPIVTHRFPVSQIQEAFETFRDKRDGALKVIVDFQRPGG